MAETKWKNCFKCGGEICELNYCGIKFDACQNCGGFFLGRDLIQTATALAESDAVSAGERKGQSELDRKDMVCPRCQCHMKKKSDSVRKAIVLDICPSCQGIWFDCGEYAKYRGFSRENSPEKAELFKVHLYCETCGTVLWKPEGEQNTCRQCGNRLSLVLVTAFVRPFWRNNHFIAAILFVMGMSIIYLAALKAFGVVDQAVIFSGTVGLVCLFFLIRAIIYGKIAWKATFSGPGIVRDFDVD